MPRDWVDGVGEPKIQAVLSPKLVLTIAETPAAGAANFGLPSSRAHRLEVSRNLSCRVDEVSDGELSPGSGTILDATISGLYWV